MALLMERPMTRGLSRIGISRFSIRYLLCGLCASSESRIERDERAVKTRGKSEWEEKYAC